MAIQGVEQNNEISRPRILRDTRPLSQQLFETFASFEVMLVVYACLLFSLVVMPALFDLALLVGLAYFVIPYLRKPDIPFRMRKSLRKIDKNDRHPGTNQPQKARGIAFIANRISNNAEIWAANEDLRTHMFILGSTGAGKTEGLISIAYNALVWGSGFSYVDGKGDVSLWAKIFTMARSMGREDDLLVINYMTGNADTTKKRSDKLSNSYNPFATGNAESLIQLIVSLMDASDGKGDMWKGRAISFISSLMPALVNLRDQGLLMLHIGAIREYLPFPRYFELMNDPSISDRSRTTMQAFLYDVPGYKRDKADNQSATFLEQYGYQQMQFTRILSSLADTYGHIYHTPQGEVNLKDVAINRRILLVLLPALEKSRPELGNLGKIIVAGMKSMMGGELGNKLEGSKLELLDARATNSPTPCIAIFDEMGYYLPDDAALMWAQARSLGFALVAAGQDIQAFYRTSKEETLAIVSNSNIKVCGKLEDPTDTYDLIEKLASEAYVSVVDGYERDLDSLSGAFRSNQTARIERVKRIELQDLQRQIEGEVHIIVKANIIRARMFYAAPKPAADYRLNHFVRVLPPDAARLRELQINIDELAHALQENPFSEQVAHDGLFGYVHPLRARDPYAKYLAGKSGVERGICLFAHFDPDAPAVVGGDDDAAGGGGGYVHTPTVGTELNVADTPVGTQLIAAQNAEAGSEAAEGSALLAAGETQAELADRVPDQAHGAPAENIILDGGKLESVSIFEHKSKSTIDFAALVCAAAPVIEAALGQKISTPASQSGAGSVSSGGLLDESGTAATLNAVALGLGASQDEATQAARALISAATSGTEYPVPPKPIKEGKDQDMEDVLTNLESLISRE